MQLRHVERQGEESISVINWKAEITGGKYMILRKDVHIHMYVKKDDK
jgi:hypothetical protein